ncbi:MAG: hypothetical protein IJP16_05480 [Clostridia bacterium]|nr:hypothetical protein [Clostridia bacterium]
MVKKYKRLSELLSKKAVSWVKVEKIIASLGDDINKKYSDSIHDNATMLSELYLDSDPYERGDVLVELTRLFLKHGYDVHANNDINGAICLHSLCWASYDKYVLHAAELLLNAGANTHIKIEDDDEVGILNSISWKFGYWNTGEYDTANMFEAYYQMVQAEQSGEDYHGIRDASDCLDMTVTRVEGFNAPDIASNQIAFDNAIVIWFGSMPLVIDKRVELVVNPCRVNKQSQRVDLSDVFSSIIGHKLIKYSYADAECVSLFFDNDIKLVLSNNRTGNEEDFIGYLKISS